MRGNALRGDGTRLYDGGNTDIVQRDSGYLAVPPISAVAGHRTGDQPMPEVERGCGQTRKVGAYANQCLNLTQLGRPMEERPWFRTGPGKTGRPGLSGGPAKRSHGGIVNPSCNRKGKYGNPAPTAGARGFYPNQGERWST